MDSAATATETVFFSREYKYRTPLVLLYAIIFLALGIACFIQLGPFVLKENLQPYLVLSSFLICAFTPFLIGALFLHRYILNRRILLIISSCGIRYGESFWPWSNIRRLFAFQYSNGGMLYFQSRSFPGLDRALATTPGLTEDEYSELMQTIYENVPDLKTELG